MLHKTFFMTQSFNPGPYSVLNLSGAQKYEEDTVYPAGKYKIEVCSGEKDVKPQYIRPNVVVGPKLSPIIKEELITEPFIIRAYCGSNGTYVSDTQGQPGVNLYEGIFKVNAVDSRTLSQYSLPDGIDVTHIFGAGGGNYYYNDSTSGISGPGSFSGGGGNCLGNGSCRSYYTGDGGVDFGGAGSCLHLMPVGGVFGTNYLRCYHCAPGDGGGAFGGGSGDVQTSGFARSTRGGNSPYGNGGTSVYPVKSDTGIGGGTGGEYQASAYFDGTMWHDIKGNIYHCDKGVITETSYIRITFLEPLKK